jgi:anhydro-N-acetylmuramic acid kinase
LTSGQKLYVGIMSGTSLDGIDAALVEFSDGLVQLKGTHYQPYEQALKDALLALHHPANNELHQAQLTGNELARHYATATAALLQKNHISPNQVRAIGCHGQTIRHRPEHGYTVQLGNAALLAELTGITVIGDFRSRDIAAGGQGAPLVPAFHDKVLRHPGTHRVIVNIGGISNLTDLPPDRATTGFDCGPGNLLMDAWCMQHLGKPYDENGAWAATGKVLPALQAQMLEEPFFALPPPKSSGRDLFNTAWLQNKLHGAERAEDVQATLLELTCRTIAQAVHQHCAGAKEIYLCGGGARNQTLHDRLAALLPDSSVQTTNVLGVDSDYLEAIAFAWLAQQTLHGQAANLPLVTGAKHPCVLGAIYPA